MSVESIWNGTVSTSTAGNVILRVIRSTDDDTGSLSYTLEFKASSDLLGASRWLALLTVNSHSIPGVPQPDHQAVYELFTEAIRRLGNASKRKHALLAQVTSTTITQELLTSIQAEIAAGEV